MKSAQEGGAYEPGGRLGKCRELNRREREGVRAIGCPVRAVPVCRGRFAMPCAVDGLAVTHPSHCFAIDRKRPSRPRKSRTVALRLAR